MFVMAEFRAFISSILTVNDGITFPIGWNTFSRCHITALVTLEGRFIDLGEFAAVFGAEFCTDRQVLGPDG